MKTSPPDLSPEDRSVVFHNLDLNLNRLILEAFLHGLYSGIVTVALWVIYSAPKRLRNTFLCTTIIALYVLSTITFGISWSSERRGFIDQGANYYSIFRTLVNAGTGDLISSVTGGVSTLLVDIVIIWRCWTLWEHQWKVIFLPIICTIGSTIMKAMQLFSLFHNATNDISAQFAPDVNWSLINVVLMLATTILCTFFIVYRVFRHFQEMSASRKIIKMLIESSAMYSTSLIIYLVVVSRNSSSGYYADIISAYIRAISPTLLAGRISAHANERSRRQKMFATWDNHPPLVGCFSEAGMNNSHCSDDERQTVLGSSIRKETV
ncbi:hypothetical protein EDD18DRAFT_1358013 [Armillaria luteobubalina]|uniref:Uncharacterized protein n=1 Tax=Armillaria luteobubalina TaxID=153913 RepID=A0AA39PXD8_9AGAR|nr:hypothetical protein EDD18DRAFT_1358013 [Armillaria luteobubalina]